MCRRLLKAAINQLNFIFWQEHVHDLGISLYEDVTVALISLRGSLCPQYLLLAVFHWVGIGLWLKVTCFSRSGPQTGTLLMTHHLKWIFKKVLIFDSTWSSTFRFSAILTDVHDAVSGN